MIAQHSISFQAPQKAMIKYILVITFAWFLSNSPLRADSLTLSRTYELAYANAPVLQQVLLLEEAYQMQIDLLKARLFPDLTMQGQATYQSEVVSLPFSMPNTEPIDLPKERAQATLNINQVILDGGRNKVARELENDQLQIDKKQLEFDKHQIKVQVNDIFFSIIMARQKERILTNTFENLRQKISTLQVSVKNGVVLESELLKLETELLKLQQQMHQNSRHIEAAIKILSMLTGKEFDKEISLIEPETQFAIQEISIQRPELEIIPLQQQKIETSENMISAQNRPQLNAFVQGGVGYPNPLNFFDDATSPFYLAGLKFNWKIWDWNAAGKEKAVLNIQQLKLEKEQYQRLRNIMTNLENIKANISQLEQTINEDRNILDKQSQITRLSSVQLENGVITSTEYLDQLNSEKQSRLNLEMHLVQLQQQKINYLTVAGKDF